LNPPVVLGVSASLRNARFGRGSQLLVEELRGIRDKSELTSYLERQSKIITSQFFESGRDEGLPFDELYRRFKKASGDRGLSNSESAIVAALFGAQQAGCDVDHVSLAKHFLPNGNEKNLDELKAQLLRADALIIGGPVYFGDRGSLTQTFIEYLGKETEVREHLQGRVYGGVAVGAKRNGGQETTLIYQLIDMTNLGMLGVGNDSATTSQYGGTAVAGDVGTFHEDDYGIETCIGTGRRVARVVSALDAGQSVAMNDRLRLDIWVLQDSEDRCFERHFTDLLSHLPDEVVDACDIRLRNLSDAYVRRCIACDICPTDIGPAKQYRCIITAKDDLFVQSHADLVDTDAVLIAAYSPVDRRDINSQYQRFIERTRYWRRDDYLMGDLPMAPFVISEIGANQNLHIRAMTSAVRHHSVLHRPIIGFEHQDELLNRDEMARAFTSFVHQSSRLTRARLTQSKARAERVYNPLGYVISKEKSSSDRKSKRWSDIVAERTDLRHQEATVRLSSKSSER